ncbi:MAG: ComF family protein [Aggregatilineales bacterium]
MPVLLASSTTSGTPEAQAQPGLLASDGAVRRWLDLALDLVFPPRCAGCGRVDARWCARCQRRLEALPLAAPVTPHPPLAAAAATGPHEGLLQRAVWALKFDNGRHLAGPLGDRLAARLSALDWPADAVIVPVPLHPARLAERGYNQSQLLAEQLAASTGRLCMPYALKRVRQTRSQVGLDRDQRQANMAGAFAAESEQISGRSVLLLDDVYTTGSTMAACAEAAHAAGARAVYGLTVTAAGG